MFICDTSEYFAHSCRGRIYQIAQTRTGVVRLQQMIGISFQDQEVLVAEIILSYIFFIKIMYLHP